MSDLQHLHIQRLHQAIRTGNEQAALESLTQGADPLASEGWDDRNALHAAAFNRRPELVHALLENPQVRGVINHPADGARHTALMLVFKDEGGYSFDDFSAHDTAQALLKAGADPTIRTPDGMTALDLALRQHRAQDSLAVLCAHPQTHAQLHAYLNTIPPDIACDDALRANNAPGLRAALNRCPETDQHRDLNRDLMVSARQGRANVVAELLAFGADPNAVSHHVTPLMRAASDLQHRGDHTAVIHHLATAGADLDAMDERGNTALNHAAYWRHADRVAALIEAGADATLCNHQGASPADSADRDSDPKDHPDVRAYRDARIPERAAITAQFLHLEASHAQVEAAPVRRRRM